MAMFAWINELKLERHYEFKRMSNVHLNVRIYRVPRSRVHILSAKRNSTEYLRAHGQLRLKLFIFHFAEVCSSKKKNFHPLFFQAKIRKHIEHLYHFVLIN